MSDLINKSENVDISSQEYVCKIKDIKALYVTIKSLFSDNAFGISLFFTGVTFVFVLISLTSGKNLYTAGSIMMAVAGLFFNAYTNNKNKAKNESEFFLTEIKNYFLTSLSSLNEKNNSNINWHKAILCLKQAEDLYDFITEDAHKILYVSSYMITAYSIHDIINKIDSYKFFFGVPNYQGKDVTLLFEESTPNSNKRLCAVSPDNLNILKNFLVKANGYEQDRYRNKSLYSTMVSSDYSLTKIYDPEYTLSVFGGSIIIDEYIEEYSRLKKIATDKTIKSYRKYVEENDMDI